MNNEENEKEININNIIICPKCSESINNYNITNENKNELILKDFTKLFCEKCSIKFTFISCLFCQKYIYMKINPNEPKYNGLNAFNIICPYKTCGKHFYFTECFKCKRAQKQNNYIKEGDVITCIFDDCKCEYIQTNCIVKDCPDTFSDKKPQNYKNYPLGIMDMHQKKIMFQKITCFYCLRPIVYCSLKTKKNKYWECQKVICPYQDCKNIFNRIICPFCYKEIYVKDGWYEMGSEIKCNYCKKFFCKIICPSCRKINQYKNYNFVMGLNRCNSPNCLKYNFMVNCIYCRKLNIFNNNIPEGQIIKCGYCHNTFNDVLCPFCKLPNHFPLADFSFGKVYKCNYSTCLKEFIYIICPNCLLTQSKNEKKEGQKIRCHRCNIFFRNWACPFCYCSILDKESNLIMGQMVKCPSEKCGKKYSFIQCSGCEKLIYSKENKFILGTSVKCPYPGCGVYSLAVKCPSCETKLLYKGENKSYNEGDNITCENCKKEFKFKKFTEIYNGNLIVLKEIEGQTIDFGVGEVDENFLMKKDLFFDEGAKKSRLFPTQFISDVLNDKSLQNETILYKDNIILKECIICHRNYSESIFYPCGHRCVCYNCAVDIFSVYKKCPKCKQKAKCIIKKVYE